MSELVFLQGRNFKIFMIILVGNVLKIFPPKVRRKILNFKTEIEQNVVQNYSYKNISAKFNLYFFVKTYTG